MKLLSIHTAGLVSHLTSYLYAWQYRVRCCTQATVNMAIKKLNEPDDCENTELKDISDIKPINWQNGKIKESLEKATDLFGCE